MSAKAGKRPLRSLTAHEKLEAIRRVHDGESKASVARDIGVPESTLRGWCKNEDKISYLSRQSTPETDDSAEPKEKRSRLEDTPQPFNLSVKSNGTPVYSPSPEVRYSTEVQTKPENLADKKSLENGYGKLDHHHHHHQLHVTPKSSAMSERERNRAELARLSIELGLNRPEMFVPTINSALGNLAPASLPASLSLMSQQWPNSMVGGVKKPALSVDQGSAAKPPTDREHKTDKNQSAVDDSVWYWLQTQQAMLGLVQNSANPAGAQAAADPTTSSWFWKWYKQFAYGTQQQQLQQHQQQQQTNPEKPILYQQLTKDKDAGNTENLKSDSEKPPAATIKNNTKARAVLDNLLLNNNNNVAVNKKDSKLGTAADDNLLSASEALEHGEKFLKWLEHCSEPSVTAMQILQFRYLLSNIKNGADRKNGEQKTKVKRK